MKLAMVLFFKQSNRLGLQEEIFLCKLKGTLLLVAYTKSHVSYRLAGGNYR
jgi:hypothetical protein